MNRFAKLTRDYSLAAFALTVGVIFAMVGILYFNYYNRTKNYPTTEAVVSRTVLFEEEHFEDETHYDATYTVYVTYTVNDITYDEEYGVFSNMKVGDKVTVSYNPRKPSEVSQPASFLWVIIFPCIGVVGLGVGTFSLVKTIKKNKKLKLQEEEWANE